jgi:hypothetical protein
MTTPEQLNDLRQRVLAGQDVSIEEYALLIQSLRARRSGEVTASAERKAAASKSPAKPAKAPVALPDILADL